MGTITEGSFEQSRRRSSSNSVDRTRTSTWKKKRLSCLNEIEVYEFTSMHAYPYISMVLTYIIILNASKMFTVIWKIFIVKKIRG